MDDKTWELLFKRLDTIEENLKGTGDDVKEIRKEMTTLKVKVAGVGALVGAVAAHFKTKLGL